MCIMSYQCYFNYNYICQFMNCQSHNCALETHNTHIKSLLGNIILINSTKKEVASIEIK